MRPTQQAADEHRRRLSFRLKPLDRAREITHLARRLPFNEARLDELNAGSARILAGQASQQEIRREPRKLYDFLADGRQARIHPLTHGDVVKTYQRNIYGHTNPALLKSL
jgi:hypothetical protein